MNVTGPVAAIIVALSLCAGGSVFAAEDRALPLKGVKNTRDLGGLQTEDGRTVRAGQLIQSCEIDHISPESKARLDEIGVTSIVDLRTTKEATTNPAQWQEGQGPARYDFPPMERETQLIDDMRAGISTVTAEVDEIDGLVRDSCAYFATDYTTELRDLFNVLLQQPEGEAIV